MVARIKAKAILQLRAAGHSRNAIAKSLKSAKKSVFEVFDRADEMNISYGDIADKDDDAVYRLIFPERFSTERIFEQPDWDYIHKELGRVGVTLSILHAEHVDKRVQANGVYMSYATFCREYDNYAVSRDLTSHIERKAGRSVEVDWSGPTMAVANPETGEISKAYLFVASLPCSRYDCVEPTLDMKQDTWLLRHVHMFELYGGSAPRLIPDNLKVGVTKHPKEGEVVLNDACREMATHCSSAVLPARVLSPEDKPNAGGAVGNIAADIIAALRNTAFISFAELKLAVSEKPTEHNARPFQKREGSRLQCFEAEEKELLQPLPAVPFEISNWVRNRRAAPNRHAPYAKNRYSCSWRYVGQCVDLRITDTVVEIYKGSERLAVHPLMPAWAKNKYSTRECDIPESKVYREWDSARIRKRAARIGPATEGCANRILESVKIDERGFDAALALLRLFRTYSQERLEKACSMALAKVRPPRCCHVKPILESNQDKIDGKAGLEPAAETGGCIRGAHYYAEGE